MKWHRLILLIATSLLWTKTVYSDWMPVLDVTAPPELQPPGFRAEVRYTKRYAKEQEKRKREILVVASMVAAFEVKSIAIRPLGSAVVTLVWRLWRINVCTHPLHLNTKRETDRQTEGERRSPLPRHSLFGLPKLIWTDTTFSRCPLTVFRPKS